MAKFKSSAYCVCDRVYCEGSGKWVQCLDCKQWLHGDYSPACDVDCAWTTESKSVLYIGPQLRASFTFHSGGDDDKDDNDDG